MPLAPPTASAPILPVEASTRSSRRTGRIRDNNSYSRSSMEQHMRDRNPLFVFGSWTKHLTSSDSMTNPNTEKKMFLVIGLFLSALVDDESKPGIKPLLMDQSSLEKMENPLNLSKLEDSEKESCPFWWARSPWNMLRQETYLALASAFLILRLIYFFLPVVLKFVHCAWRRLIQNASLMKMWEHPLACLARATQVLNALKEPCKMSNLQEGAINARAWASKSLASVSIGDASSSRRE